MKKILGTIALLPVFATGLAAAEAEPGVSISGDAYIRAFYRKDLDFGADPAEKTDTFLDSRARFMFRATTPGGAYALGRIILMDHVLQGNESDSAATTMEGNIWADVACIGVPFGEHFTLEGGKYRASIGTGFFYDDLSKAGLRGIITYGDLEIVPFVEWHSEGRNSGIALDRLKDNDAILTGLHVSARLGDNWKGGLFAGYQSDDRAELVTGEDGTSQTFHRHKGWLASAYFDGRMGNFGLSGEIAFNDSSLNGFNNFLGDRHDYGEDEWGTDAGDDGFGAYLRPTWTADALTLSLNLGFTEGDFTAQRAFGYVLIGGDHPLTVYSVGDRGDWLWAGLTAAYAVNDRLELVGNLAWAEIDGRADIGAESLERAVELSAGLRWNITPGAGLAWFVGALIPSFADPAVADDPAIGSYAMLNVSF